MTDANLKKVLNMLVTFNSETDYYNLLETILAQLMDYTNADGGTLYVKKDEKLFFRIVRTISQNKYISAKEESNMPPIDLDEENILNISAYAAIKNQIVVVDDVYSNDFFNFEGPKKYDAITGYRTKSVLVLPLSTNRHAGSEVIGVIQLLNSIDPITKEVVAFGDIFNPPILPSIAKISGNVLANILFVKEIKGLLDSLIRAMAKTIDERTPYNKNHTYNVAKYCYEFVEYLNGEFPKDSIYYFDENRKEQLFMAAMLHDIGKITTPLDVMDKPDRLSARMESVRQKFHIKKQQTYIQFLENKIDGDEYNRQKEILNEGLSFVAEVNTSEFLTKKMLEKINKLKQLTYVTDTGEEKQLLTDYELESLSIKKGTLTNAERKKMEEHVVVTGRILDQMKFPMSYQNVPIWARSHHEMVDGSGYPNGISGDVVTLEMSILAVADVFDALTARDRPYKKPMAPEKAIGILKEMAKEGKFPIELIDYFEKSKVWK